MVPRIYLFWTIFLIVKSIDIIYKTLVSRFDGGGNPTIYPLNTHGTTVIYIQFTTHPGEEIIKGLFDGKSFTDCCKDLYMPLSDDIKGTNYKLYLVINALPIPIFLKQSIFTPYYLDTNTLITAKGHLEFPTEHSYKDMLPENQNVSNYVYGQFIKNFPVTQLHALPSVLKANMNKEVVIRYVNTDGKGACEMVILGDVVDPNWNHLVDSEAYSAIEFLDYIHSFGGATKNHKGLIN